MHLKSSHLDPGQARAYLDNSLSAEDQAKAESHLAICPRCYSLVAETQQRAERVHERLSLLEPPDQSQSPVRNVTARARLTEKLNEDKEKQSMKPNIFSRIPRSAWAGIALVVALAVSLTFEPVRVLANSFLALFRVEQIRVVQFDPDQMSQKLENSSQLEYMMSNDVKVEELGEPQETASAEEASALVGFPLRLPAALEGKQHFVVQPGAKLSFTVNLELVRGVLKDLQREDIQLPDALDGAVIQMEIPASVMAAFGDCAFPTTDQIDPDNPPQVEPMDLNCQTLVQVPSPVVSAPPDLNLAQIGEAYLQVLGMNPQDAATFARDINWTTTFVVPLPRYYTDYEEVDINGVPGTLIYDKNGYRPDYALIWIKDGIIYALNGRGDSPSALEIARSIP